jgi:hypothetical protein
MRDARSCDAERQAAVELPGRAAHDFDKDAPSRAIRYAGQRVALLYAVQSISVGEAERTHHPGLDHVHRVAERPGPVRVLMTSHALAHQASRTSRPPSSRTKRVPRPSARHRASCRHTCRSPPAGSCRTTQSTTPSQAYRELSVRSTHINCAIGDGRTEVLREAEVETASAI